MKITSEQFLSYVNRAFKSGYDGTDKDEFMRSITSELGDCKEDSETDFRIYSVDELRAAPDGSTFLSEPLGPFKITVLDNGSKVCIFANIKVLSVASLNCSGFPFNKGIRKISVEDYEEMTKSV